MFTVNAAAGVKIPHQHTFEQPALGDVKTSVLGQDLDVLHFVVEPAKTKCDSVSTDASTFLPSSHNKPSLKSAENKCKNEKQNKKAERKHGRFTDFSPLRQA